jgi:serpin B
VRQIIPFLFICALGAAVSFSGCRQSKEEEDDNGPGTLNLADLPYNKSVKAELVKGNTAFALDLYQQLKTGRRNLFFSPYSISTALAMTYNGARGQTAKEMARALHFPSDRNAMNPAFTNLLRTIQSGDKDRGYQVLTANALWGQKSYAFEKGFLDGTRKYYGAGLKEVDFQEATEEARREINHWVEEQTRDHIKDLIGQGVLTGETRLVLTNAIYFKGKWANEFRKTVITDEDFWLTKAKKVSVPMMHQQHKFRYAEGKDFQVLELPYKGDDVSLVIVLPRAKEGLAALERVLNPAQLSRWLDGLAPATVSVTLARFKMTAAVRLEEQLAALGMLLAFTDGADFSGMEPKKQLYLSAVIHKAFVEVNEEGTEAAAATGVAVETKSEKRVEDEVHSFRADHPFLFMIRDNRSGSILFLGRLSDPR